jgi:hypothetical protein
MKEKNILRVAREKADTVGYLENGSARFPGRAGARNVHLSRCLSRSPTDHRAFVWREDRFTQFYFTQR